MTTLDKIDVPPNIIHAANIAHHECEPVGAPQDIEYDKMTAAIRAALQAWVDSGRAKTGAAQIETGGMWNAFSGTAPSPEYAEFPVLILRLDAKEPGHET